MDKEKAIEVLKKIEDPELGLDIWTLGLVYKVEVKERDVFIDLTFTSPMCPYGPMLLEQIDQELRAAGFFPKIEVVFSPPWKPSDEVKMMLGLL